MLQFSHVAQSVGVIIFIMCGKTMGLFLELTNKIKNSGFLILCVLLFFYFSFYTINGERGLLKYMYLSKEIAYAKDIAAQYSAQKQKLEAKVRLLSSSSLDLDMLDERARVVLNFAGDDEFVILDDFENN